MFSYAIQQINEIESSITQGATRAEIIQKLRSLALCDFGELLFSIPNQNFPKMSALLPKMASEEVQKTWTGASGEKLLIQTLDFVRSVAYNYSKFTGRVFENNLILDFGCGYGRIARIMYYFTNEINLFGVDSWGKSIEICHQDGLVSNFVLSDNLPLTLPVGDLKFDLIYAFSVFTHLSDSAARTCLNTMYNYLNTDGLIVLTVRPIEFWDVGRHPVKKGVSQQQKNLHIEHGFSFLPYETSAPDVEATYGDTSMSLEWLSQTFPKLKLVGIDSSLSDQHQIYCFLQKKTFAR